MMTRSAPPPLCAVALPASTTDKSIHVYVDAIEPPNPDIRLVSSDGDTLTIENLSTESLVVLDAQKRPINTEGPGMIGPASTFQGQGGIWDRDPSYEQQHTVDLANKPSTYLRWTIFLRGSTQTTRVSGHTDLLPRHEGSLVECTAAWATIIGASAGFTLLYALIFLGPPALIVLLVIYGFRRLRRGAQRP